MSAYFKTVAKRKDELVVLFYIVTENASNGRNKENRKETGTNKKILN